MARFDPEERRDTDRDLSHDELDLHQLMLRRSKLKSTVRTSTLLAGFAMVSWSRVARPLFPVFIIKSGLATRDNSDVAQ